MISPQEAALVRAIRRAMAPLCSHGSRDNGLVSFRVEDIYTFVALLDAEGVTASDEQREAA